MSRKLTPQKCKIVCQLYAREPNIRGVARRVGVSPPTVYRVLRDAGLWSRAARDGAGRPSAGQAEVHGGDALVRVLPSPGVVLILGKRGGGKSALAYRLAERLRSRAAVFAVGVPRPARRYLPSWIGTPETLWEVPGGAVVILDESYLVYHARAAMRRESREAGQLEGLVRHKGWLLILISHQARRLDKDLVSGVDLLLWKEPERLQGDFERPELREGARRAARAFGKFAVGERPQYTYVVEPGRDFEGMIVTALPTFWSEEFSRAFADWTPKTAETPEPGTIARREAVEVQPPSHLPAKRVESALWRLVDGGWSLGFAKEVARASVDSLAGHRLARLEGCLKTLLRGGLDRGRLERFVIRHLASPFLLSHLSALAEIVPAIKHVEPRTAEDLLTRLFAEPALLRPLADALRPLPAARQPPLLEGYARELDRQARTRTLTEAVRTVLSPATPLLARLGLAGLLVWGVRSGRFP